MDGLVSVNGELLHPSQASISALDRGFLFGDNVFEVFVAFYDTILDTQKHLDRLRRSAADLEMAIPWTDEQLVEDLREIARRVRCPKKYIRLVITRGEGLGLGLSPGLKCNKVVYCFPAKREDRKLYTLGVALKRMVKPETERRASAKTGNYLRSIVAMEKARRKGFQDVLWTNSGGEITEATTANIFFLAREGDRVHFVTPSPMSGILLGITRETVCELMRMASIPVHEQIIFADELAKYDEAFLCSTVRGLVPIARVDDHKYYTLRRNSVYQHIERLYLTWVETQVGFRVDWMTGERIQDDDHKGSLS